MNDLSSQKKIGYIIGIIFLVVIVFGIFIYVSSQKTQDPEIVVKPQDKTYYKYVSINNNQYQSITPTRSITATIIPSPIKLISPTIKILNPSATPTNNQILKDNIISVTVEPTEIIIAQSSSTSPTLVTQNIESSSSPQISSIPIVGSITGGMILGVLSSFIIVISLLL